MNSPDY